MSADTITIDLLTTDITVEIAAGADVVVTLPPTMVVVDVTPVGYPGPAGASGLTGVDYVQASAAATWTIAHNLGYRPSVSAFTVGGVSLLGTVTHLDVNTLTLAFAVPVAGFARVV